MSGRNWFETLNDSLAAEGLVDRWPLGLNVAYGQTVSLASGGRWISVYRDTQGRYERPVHYATLIADTHTGGQERGVTPETNRCRIMGLAIRSDSPAEGVVR